MPPVRLITVAALLSFAPVMVGCASMADRVAAPARPVAAMPGQLEPIHAAAFTNDQAVFRVSSNGCTDRDDITPIVTRQDGQDSIITLRRTVDDTCKRRDDDGVQLIWSFEELGLDPGEMVEVNNPFLLPPTAAETPRG